MLKYAVASAVLILGFAVSAMADPRNEEAQPPKYDTESPARIRQEMDRRAPDATTLPAPERATYPDRPAGATYPDRPAGATDTGSRYCPNCPPPRHYDNVETVKTSRDVDHSRVINTESVVEVPSRTKEVNKLIVNENETRNVGVVQHNHRIIEKEIRYVRRAPPVYRPAPVHRAPRVQTVLVPIVQQAPCGCPCSCGGGHGSYAQAHTQTYVYADRYSYARPAPQPTTQYVLVPVQQSGGYAYAYR